jgi:hypothetical protein
MMRMTSPATVAAAYIMRAGGGGGHLLHGRRRRRLGLLHLARRAARLLLRPRQLQPPRPRSTERGSAAPQPMHASGMLATWHGAAQRPSLSFTRTPENKAVLATRTRLAGWLAGWLADLLRRLRLQHRPLLRERRRVLVLQQPPRALQLLLLRR